MHLHASALPGASSLLLDPAAQAVAAQVFGPRSPFWAPGPRLLIGDLVLATVGAGVKVKEGTNARMGTAVLVAGTVVVATTAVTASSRIFLTAQTTGGTPGALRVSARTAAASFTITSTNAADTSTVAWIIFEPA